MPAQTRNALIGHAALKTDYLSAEVAQHTERRNWHITSEDVFGGYGHFNAELLDFIAATEATHGLPLDPVYTGKAYYRLCQHIQRATSRPTAASCSSTQAAYKATDLQTAPTA
jgi:1-aminocyclopropane-1-carboxylate deaminase/D-cysteine desulfhydrase-like pyridoxal-dependent ACC family enzyme